MPTKDRREREQLKKADADGSYGPIDTGYVFGNPIFRGMPPTAQYLEVLAWLACFKERTDTLKPEWVAEIKRQSGIDRARIWHETSTYLAEKGRWILCDDGSVIVCKIKDKRPRFPWKQKGINGNDGAGNALNKRRLPLRGKSALLETGTLPPQDDGADTPLPRPTESVTANFKRILAEKKASG